MTFEQMLLITNRFKAICQSKVFKKARLANLLNDIRLIGMHDNITARMYQTVEEELLSL